MLARAWWPVQSWCRQRPVTVVASVIVITTLLGGESWQRLPTLSHFTQGQLASLGVTVSALAFAAREKVVEHVRTRDDHPLYAVDARRLEDVHGAHDV